MIADALRHARASQVRAQMEDELAGVEQPPPMPIRAAPEPWVEQASGAVGGIRKLAQTLRS